MVMPEICLTPLWPCYGGCSMMPGCSFLQQRFLMGDPDGLDPDLLAFSRQKLDALQTALMSSLQSGAFFGNAMLRCDEPDGPLHWLVCPRYEEARQDVMGWVDSRPQDSKALRAHLLPSRSYTFCCTVEDGPCGFDPSQNHISFSAWTRNITRVH